MFAALPEWIETREARRRTDACFYLSRVTVLGLVISIAMLLGNENLFSRTYITLIPHDLVSSVPHVRVPKNPSNNFLRDNEGFLKCFYSFLFSCFSHFLQTFHRRTIKKCNQEQPLPHSRCCPKNVCWSSGIFTELTFFSLPQPVCRRWEWIGSSQSTLWPSSTFYGWISNESTSKMSCPEIARPPSRVINILLLINVL